MTNYQTAMLKIAQAETRDEFISIDREIKTQFNIRWIHKIR